MKKPLTETYKKNMKPITETYNKKIEAIN